MSGVSLIANLARVLLGGMRKPALAVCLAAAALAPACGGGQSDAPTAEVARPPSPFPASAEPADAPVAATPATAAASATGQYAPAPERATSAPARGQAAPTPAPMPTPGAAVSPATPEPAPTPENRARKLLAIYMVGSDLEEEDGYGSQDLLELIEGYQSLPEGHALEIIVAFGGANKNGWRGMKFANARQIIADAQDGAFGNETAPDAYLRRDESANMDDEGSLTLFLDMLKDDYPEYDGRFLVFWDHGNSYKGFGGDTNFGGEQMSMEDLAGALRRSVSGTFDLIGFDACFMASLEVARFMHPHARYMLASEGREPGHGWRWSEVVRAYAEEGAVIDVGKRIVDDFVDDVHGGARFDGRTLSLVDLGRYAEMVAALDPVVSALGRQVASRGEYSMDIAFSITRAGTFGESRKDDLPPVSIDLRHVVQMMAGEFEGTEIAPALGGLLAEIDRYVVYSEHDGSRPHANGVSIAVPDDTDANFSRYKLNDTWLEFQDAYADFRTSDTTSPAIVEQTWDDAGTLATIADEFLAEVTAVYGFVLPVANDGGAFEDVFVVVAEVEAQPTGVEGQYFAPEWDGRWLAVTYDANESAAWIPASYNGRFEDEYGEYFIYTAEIDFYTGHGHGPEFAMLTLYVDGDMKVFDHTIQTYQYVHYGGQGETIRFDKATHQLVVGDSMRFWNYGFNMVDASADGWMDASGMITFTREPLFTLEELDFRDESGRARDYYYAIWAEDLNGNGALSVLAEAGE